MQKYFYISHSHYKLEKTFQMRAVLERRGLGAGSVLSVHDQAQTQAWRRNSSSVCKTFQMRAVLERRGLGAGSVLSVRDQAQTQAWRRNATHFKRFNQDDLSP